MSVPLFVPFPLVVALFSAFFGEGDFRETFSVYLDFLLVSASSCVPLHLF